MADDDDRWVGLTDDDVAVARSGMTAKDLALREGADVLAAYLAPLLDGPKPEVLRDMILAAPVAVINHDPHPED